MLNVSYKLEKTSRIWSKKLTKSSFSGLPIPKCTPQKSKISMTLWTKLKETPLCPLLFSSALLVSRSKFSTWTDLHKTLSILESSNTQRKKEVSWLEVISNQDKLDSRQSWVISWLDQASESHQLFLITIWETMMEKICKRINASSPNKFQKLEFSMTQSPQTKYFIQKMTTKLITRS